MPRDSAKITTLADLIELIEADESLTDRQRKDWRSAIRSLGKHTGKGLGLVATPHHLPPALKGGPPQGCAPKTWANIRSGVSAALKHYGLVVHGASKTPTGLAWAPLRDTLPSPRFDRGLSRFLTWAIKAGLQPDDMTIGSFERFYNYLVYQTLCPRPEKVFRDTCQLWSRAVASVPGWPQVIVPIPSYREVVTLGEDAFPESFIADLNAWQRRVSGKDRLNRESTLKRPLRPATYLADRATFVRCASILVRENLIALESVEDLSVLGDPENVRAILQFYLDRTDNEVTRGIEKTAITLQTLARHWVKPAEADLEEIEDLTSRVRLKNRGMSETAEARLTAFDDAYTVLKFIDLPWALQAEAQRATNKTKAARLMRLAIGIAIGLSAPVRRRNLVDLHLERNISIRRKGRRVECYIHFDKSETKTREALDFILNQDVTALLLDYRDHFRPLLVSGDDQGWLFPGAKPGQSITKEAFTDHLSKQVKKRLGIEFNCHLFRHLAAKIYLKSHPEDFATVQMLLGHRQAQTTIDFYCKFDRDDALARFDDAVFKRRDGK